ncbi:MAG: hypothetical protein AAF638_02890 [Pseudomonadota bacterium]
MTQLPAVTFAFAFALLFAGGPVPSADAAEAGKWEGKRIAASATANRGVRCSPTGMSIDTKASGDATGRLLYNRTRLRGKLDLNGAIELTGKQSRFTYSFSGRVNGSRIEGRWSEAFSGCNGTWYVNKR